MVIDTQFAFYYPQESTVWLSMSLGTNFCFGSSSLVSMVKTLREKWV